MKTSLFLSTVFGALLVTGVAAAADAPMTYVGDPNITGGDLDGENELPTKVNAADTGKVKLTYHPDTKKLCGTITFTPSTFEYSMAHIHEGKATTASGAVNITLAGDKGAGEIKVDVDLTPEQITKLTTGESYVNVHSDAHPDGAMRNQLVMDDTATPEECASGTDTDAGTSSSSSSGATSSSSGSSSKDGGTSGGTSGTAATPDSTDSGGCNTSGSHGADAAALLALGAIVTAAVRRRRNKKA